MLDPISYSGVTDAWIQSYSGRKINFIDPTEDDIDIEDIAHTLSLLCRFGGHCKTFYSVGDHSLLASDYAPDEYKFELLMHDAAEAYLVDMPRPIKNVLQGYRDIESKFDTVIRRKYGLPERMTDVCRYHDDAMLATEKRDLMNPSDSLWSKLPDPHPEVVVPRTPEEVQKRFLEKFEELRF